MAARFLSALHARGRSLTSTGITLEAAPSAEVSSTDFLENRQLHMPEDPVDNPRLCAIQYAKNNRLQKKHSNLVLEFSQPAFLVDTRDTTRILDVGCGTGDFTRDSLLPSSLPCEKIVGVDISPDMIQYANRYSAHKKIEYCLLDIEKDVSEFLNRYGHFDRVYSFYCLQWLRDQGDALKNISSLLSPGGQCLLVFPATHQPAALWHRLAKMDHWEKYSEVYTYITNLLLFLPPFIIIIIINGRSISDFGLFVEYQK
ncbi:hypothetical protein HPB50_024717 [Hyalomma asiaticum]|uniref:Uncharacterized protein n=1 Tax=Hyalomma asiaticum TaxID=266040 RepID=A0ACB7SXY7_HYAAI|nr:hypothetical protein HPB50_024717 [Hyalomma asiaticum]